MKQSISIEPIRSGPPPFLYTMDENENEYIICTGKFPMILKIKDFEYEYIDDEEGDEEEPPRDPESLTGDFQVEAMKFSNTGLKPLSYEKNTKVVKEIIKRAIDFYLALEGDTQ